MLLYGSPGTGKTEAIIRLANEADVELWIIEYNNAGFNPEEFDLLFRDAEKQGKKGKKVLLFFDEIDNMIAKRSGFGMADEKTLKILSYFGKNNPNFTILGATNFIEKIDPAAIQRFTYRLHFDLPGQKERLQIFHKYVGQQIAQRPIQVDQEILNETDFINKVSMESKGLSGRSIQMLISKIFDATEKWFDNKIDKDFVIEQIKRAAAEQAVIDNAIKKQAPEPYDFNNAAKNSSE